MMNNESFIDSNGGENSKGWCSCMRSCFGLRESSSGEGSISTGEPSESRGLRRIPSPGSDAKSPCAVIVTIYDGTSYDGLFRQVEQSSPNPDFSIAVFEGSYCDLSLILKRNVLNPEPILTDLWNCIDAVNPDSVVFNFECCSNCDERGFHGANCNKSSVMKFLGWAITQGYMLSFGDFSLKSLIKDWSVSTLGPNPFVNVGTCNDHISLKFDPAVLINCPNAQLQSVGKMCESGSSLLHAMGGTIVYNVDLSKSKNKFYDLTVLTISDESTDFDQSQSSVPLLVCGEHKGTAGHVMLKYKSGGTIFVSAGHWIELNRIDANESSVLRCAAEQFGAEYASEMQRQLNEFTTDNDRDEFIQMSARRVIQSNASCQYSYNNK